MCEIYFPLISTLLVMTLVLTKVKEFVEFRAFGLVHSVIEKYGILHFFCNVIHPGPEIGIHS